MSGMRKFFGAAKRAIQDANLREESARVAAALVQDAFVEEGEELTEVSTQPTPATPASMPNFDMAAFAQILAQAIAQGQTMNAESIKALTADAIKSAREPIPEVPFVEYHRQSAFNPDGDLNAPRPGLRCDMFLGQWDDKGNVTPAFEIVGQMCSMKEQVLLNQVQGGIYPVSRHDGVTGNVIVQEQKDAAGRVKKLVIAVPHGWLGKDQQAAMPSQKNLCEQILNGSAA